MFLLFRILLRVLFVWGSYLILPFVFFFMFAWMVWNFADLYEDQQCTFMRIEVNK
jgi:hypothetical protein